MISEGATVLFWHLQARTAVFWILVFLHGSLGGREEGGEIGEDKSGKVELIEGKEEEAKREEPGRQPEAGEEGD